MVPPPASLQFPDQLIRLHARLRAQDAELRAVAASFADAIAAGGVVHVYANGHSRIAVEELVIRMGALTGFHPLLQTGLTTFTDVVGPNGIRLNQAIEKVEGLGEQLLREIDVAPGEPLLVISATGQTQAAVDIALAWQRAYPDNPLVVLCSAEQSDSSPPKHSCGKNLTHLAREARTGHILDNGMPVGDTSVQVAGRTGAYALCPVSSVGAVSVIQCLNELTLRELDRRGVAHHVLRNMHLGDTRDSYDAWLRDQRARYARALCRPGAVTPAK
jgi:uncharacterized phosphosugar-binding protein